ncbi:MAG: hypothetical protein ACHQAQ_08260 [Hyphomicrobiales bacterium]
MLTAVQWVLDPKRRSGKDIFGVEYERLDDGTILAALRISPGKRYRMRHLDWIVSGDRFPRRVTLKEMSSLYICKKGADGKTVITLKPGAVHPWEKKAPMIAPGLIASPDSLNDRNGEGFRMPVADNGAAASGHPDIIKPE